MRTQTQKHEGLGFRQTCWGKAVLLLKLFHGVTRRWTPYAIRRVVEKAGLGECFLDFPDPRGLDAHIAIMVDALMAPPVVAHVGSAHVVSLLLFCRQPDVRHQGHCQADKHGPANSPVTERDHYLFHINAEYQPGTSS